MSTDTSDANQLDPGLFVAGTNGGGAEELSAADPLIGQLLDSRYRVIERLAEGGMGTVYRAEHVALHKEVAIKLVHDAANSEHALRFLREAMLTSRIDHPNVISAIDYGTFDQGAAYLVMSLVEGPTLAHVMRLESPMPWSRAAEVGAQIADAVAAAQAQGIVHRDLKPENVVLQPMADGTEAVKVLDFGIAKYARDSMAPPQVLGAQHVTQMGVVVGTPGYMAPEQAVGMRTDHRADLYSIGVMLWECVVGRRLWDCSDVQQLLTAQLGSRPGLLRAECGDPTIPEDFEALVAALLATRPENRPQNAVETRDRLRALLDAERRDSQPRAEPAPLQSVRGAVRPEDTDTVFIDAAIAGWRADPADAPRATQAGASSDEPPTTRVLRPSVAGEAEPQPTTQHGFRAVAAEAKHEAAPDAGASLQPQVQAATDAAGQAQADPDSALDPGTELRPRVALRLYVAVPLALAGLPVALWAALALGSSTASPSASPRARASGAREPIARSADALGAVAALARPANVPGVRPSSAAAAPGPARQAATTRSAPLPAPAATRARVATQQVAPSAASRASSQSELASALRAMARQHFRHAEFELAAQTYRLAIKASPEYPGAYAGLGASELAYGDARGAIASYKQAVRRSPATSGFHAALGRAYVMARDKERALGEYRKAVALDPGNEVASKALARLTP